MIKAVLLDLDDTLLYNPTSEFVAAYFERLNAYIQRRWQVADIGDILWDIGRTLMFGSRDMRTSNLDVTLSALTACTGHPAQDILDVFNAFYRDDYAAIRAQTRATPAAAELIAALKARGYSVVIATNPIYPAEAVRQRLLWAEVAADFDHYAFVTHAGNTHFAKPQPEYYAEILGRIGVEPDEAIMIGNDQRHDIDAARAAGLHTWHVEVQNLHSVIDQIDVLEAFAITPLTPAMIAPQMRGNIGALYGLTSTIKPHFWNQHPDPREWSPIQIICHLIDKEVEAFYPRLERILTQDNPFIVETLPLGPDDYSPCAVDGQDALEQFVAARERTLALIQTFTTNDWQRRARHSIFGNTTMLEMAHFSAQHDRLHLRQLCQTIGRCQ
ncbi:MAG TPA: HAD-IIIA family hydrolase [Aggregatilineales bacterium]|nr:HAD-IIIA family hydrolase [Aggregatilineales bacterium]